MRLDQRDKANEAWSATRGGSPIDNLVDSEEGIYSSSTASETVGLGWVAGWAALGVLVVEEARECPILHVIVFRLKAPIIVDSRVMKWPWCIGVIEYRNIYGYL